MSRAHHRRPPTGQLARYHAQPRPMFGSGLIVARTAPAQLLIPSPDRHRGAITPRSARSTRANTTTVARHCRLATMSSPRFKAWTPGRSSNQAGCKQARTATRQPGATRCSEASACTGMVAAMPSGAQVTGGFRYEPATTDFGPALTEIGRQVAAPYNRSARTMLPCISSGLRRSRACSARRRT